MKKKTLVYVIGAYSGDTKANIQKAEDISIALICAGYHVITPHKNISYSTWINMDLNILSRCDAIFIMDNAKNSHGSQVEIEYAKSINLPEVRL